MGTFVPNTKEQQLEMLREIGYEKLDDLFAHIPSLGVFTY
jgi:glycine dehydrogenase subunit 1